MAQKKYDTAKNYSIRRNPKDLIFNVVGLIVVVDALYLVLVLILIAIRSSLKLDVTLVGLNVMLFFIKTTVAVFWSHKLLASWLKVDYYILNGQLVVEGYDSGVKSTVHNLDEILGVTVEQPTFLGRSNNFGNINVKIMGKAEPLVLHDVEDPKQVANDLYSKSSI